MTDVNTPLIVGALLLSYIPISQANTESDVETISVTASKTSQTISQTPDSISAILNQEVELIAPQHINQVLDAIPGTWISRGNGQEHLTAIRSPVLTGAGSCGAFFMGLDGISIRAPGFCNANQLFDINYEQAAQIDVLRSPASTLYGANALHGVINIISQDAFASTGNSIGLQAGSYGFAKLSSKISGSGNDSAWLNLLNVTHEEGFQAQSGFDQQKMTHIVQFSGHMWSNKTVIDMSNLNQETAGFIRGFESYKDTQLRRSNPNPEAFRDVKSLRAYSTFSRAIGTDTLSLTPYLRYNEMRFLQHFLPWQALEENGHHSLGLQTKYEYSWAGIEWLSGVDGDFTRASLTETQDDDFSPNIPRGVHYDYRVNASQFTAYTQGIWQRQNWLVRFGARLENNRYDYNSLVDGSSACADSVPVCRFTRPEDQQVDFTAISPSINVQYFLEPSLSIYAKFSQGFRAPQATELFRLQNNQRIADIDNENMNAYEAGLRYASTHTNVHLALYDMHKKDVIFQDSNRQNISGAQTSHTGVELEIRHSINPSWFVHGHVSYAKHEYTNNVSIASVPIKGNIIDTAPEWMSNVSINYRPDEKLTAQLTYQYTSEYYLNPENTAKYDGHHLIDANIKYQLSSQVNVSLHLLNLSDQDYAERADFAFGAYRYFVGQPRRAFVNISWSY